MLLACLLSDDPVFQKVLKNLHIESLESALFVLKEPHRLREVHPACQGHRLPVEHLLVIRGRGQGEAPRHL